MEAANHPEFKLNIIFLTHFLCSSRSFTRSAFSKTTTEPHSDTDKPEHRLDFCSRENSEKSTKIQISAQNFPETLDEIMGKYDFPVHPKNPQNNLQVGSQHWYHLGEGSSAQADGGGFIQNSQCAFIYTNLP